MRANRRTRRPQEADATLRRRRRQYVTAIDEFLSGIAGLRRAGDGATQVAMMNGMAACSEQTGT